MPPKKDCPEGKVINPVTGRCVSPSYLIQKKISVVTTSPKPKPLPSLECSEGKVKSPLSQRCISPSKLGAKTTKRRLVPVQEDVEMFKENIEKVESDMKQIEKIIRIEKKRVDVAGVREKTITVEEEPNIPLSAKRKRRLVQVSEEETTTITPRKKPVAPRLPLVSPPSIFTPSTTRYEESTTTHHYSFEDFVPVYPRQTDVNIQKIVSSKKEFADFGARTGEGIPSRGQLFSHQRLFLRLMRAYDKMLLIADPGTGKTLSFLAVTEYYKKVGVYKKAYILEKGPILLNAVKMQLACKATPKGVYDTDAVNYARTDKARATALTKAMSDFYVFKTYTTFASEFSSLKDEEVIENYSGCIFVIDEAHNLVSDAKSSDRYASILRVLTLARRIKVILATATPMVNSAKELGPLMNFILPPERAFPQDYKFTPPSKIVPEDILQRCRGFVSYVRAESLKAKSKYIGSPVRIEEIEKEVGEVEAEAGGEETATHPLVVYPVEMGDIQARAYRKVEPKETSETAKTKTKKVAESSTAVATDEEVSNENAFYIKSLQASSFVFPDGSFGGQVEGGTTNEIELAGISSRGEGEEGISKYVTQQNKKPGFYSFRTDSKSNSDFRQWKYSAGARSFKDWLSGVGRPAGTPEWYNLQRLSGKFAQIIEIETENAEKEGTSFVYSEAKNGGGAILLGLCFELFGFKRFEPAGLEFASMRKGNGTGQEEDDEEDETEATVDEEEVEVEDENDDEAKSRGVEKSRGGGGICGDEGKKGGGKRQEKMPISKGLRYALLTPEVPQSQQKQILKIFNSPENVNGEYIKTIIGSKIARDGIDLFHCVRVHLLIPPWTSSGTIQAVARALRAVSHDVLFEKRKERILNEKRSQGGPAGRTEEQLIQEVEDEARVTVSLLRHCSVSPSLKSVDEIVYRLSVVKDFEVRKIMRLLKQSAIDCELNYKRNVLVPYLDQKSILDFSQECDYSKCRYVCGEVTTTDGGSGSEGRKGEKGGGGEQRELDFTTYDLIYYREELEEATKRIIKILTEASHHTFNDTIHIQNLVKLCSPLRPASVYKALHTLVNARPRLYNSFKEKSYICVTEDGNVFLTPDLMVASTPYLDGHLNGEIKEYVSQRFFERRRPFRDATAEGVQELAFPSISSSSLATIYEFEKNLVAGGEVDGDFMKYLVSFKIKDLISFLKDEKFYSKYISIASILSAEDATSTTAFLSQTSSQQELIEEYKSYQKYLESFSPETTVLIHTAIADEEKEIIGEYASRNTRGELARMLILSENGWRFVREGIETEMAFALRTSQPSKPFVAVVAKEDLKKKDEKQAPTPPPNEVAFSKRREPLTEKEILFAKYDPSSEMLRIVDKRLKTTSTSGRVCTTYSRNELIVYCLLLVPDADAVFVAANSNVSSGKALAKKLQSEPAPDSKDAIPFAESLRKDFGDIYYDMASKVPNFAIRAFVLGRLPRNYMCGFIKNAFEFTGRLTISK